MRSDRKELEPGTLPPDTADETQEEIGAGSFSDALQMTSEAVTMLADRLNAVALRVALIGSAKSETAAGGNIETYLNRLSSLVDSAAAQMRFIQKLLHMIQISVPHSERHDGTVPHLQTAQSEETKE